MNIIEQSQIDIKIHKDHLEDDWENHSELALFYHIQLANSIKERDSLKEQVSNKEASLAIEIRKDPKLFGVEKVTENAIFELSKTNKPLYDLRNNLLELDYQVNLLKGVTIAFDHRKKALEEEVSLYIAGYFSPKLKPELKPTTDTQVKLLNTKKGKPNGTT